MYLTGPSHPDFPVARTHIYTVELSRLAFSEHITGNLLKSLDILHYTNKTDYFNELIRRIK